MKALKAFVVLLLTAYCSLFAVSDAHAMHISEGILPFGWALFWFLASAPFVLLGLHRLKKVSQADISSKPLVGLLTAAVFVISCMPIPVPVAGTTSHPCGTGMSAILLGPALSVLVAAAALLIQALLLSHGGLSTLGANIFSMGVLGSFTGFVVFKLLRGFRVSLGAAAFVAGMLADWATYAGTSFELATGIRGSAPLVPLFLKITAAFVPTQLPLGILEGMMTAGMISLLHRKRPDLLVKMRLLKAEKSLSCN